MEYNLAKGKFTIFLVIDGVLHPMYTKSYESNLDDCLFDKNNIESYNPKSVKLLSKLISEYDANLVIMDEKIQDTDKCLELFDKIWVNNLNTNQFYVATNLKFFEYDKMCVVENIISDYKIENYLILDSQFDIYHKYLNAIDIDAKTIMHINQYRCFDEFDYKYIVDNFVNYSLEEDDE